MKKISLIVGFLIIGLSLAGCDSNKYTFKKTEDEIIKEKLAERTIKEPLKVGLITDAHFYGKKVNNVWELNWRSKEALDRFIKKMNEEFQPDLVIENGDLVDGRDHNSLEDWKMADEIMKQLSMPYYHVIGNHEMRSFDKSVWLQLTGYGSPYYYNDIKGYRVIVLDANHLPGGKDTGPEKEYYPGALGPVQWQWLENVLKDAVFQDKDPVIFVHQPPVKTDAKPDWELFPKGEELHQLFDKYKVRAVFSGHIERMCDILDNETEYFILQGFWKANKGLKKEYRFGDAGNFYYITIGPDGVDVESEYRIFNPRTPLNKHLGTRDRIDHWDRLTLNREDYNCQDRKKLRDDNTAGLTIKEETGDAEE